MKPGRELDALVAEKVMEWKPPRYDDFGDIGLASMEARGIDPFEPPRYSTSIVAAWQVVGRLREKGFLFAINMADDWEVEFNLNDGRFLQNGDTMGMGHADTAPHAICLAALKAVGAI